MAVAVPLVQLRKECHETTFTECLGDTISWMSGGNQVGPGPQASVAPPAAKTVNPAPPDTSSITTQPPRDKTNVATTTPGRGFTVINAGSEPVFHVFASRCEDGNWGGDRLGKEEVIGPGQRRTLSLSDGAGQCCFDLRARFKSGTKRDFMKVDVCRLTHWTVNNQ
jgi:hypothetical protein